MVDRVRRPKDYEELMKRICINKDTKIFDTLKDCMIFCAALGAKNENYTEFSESAEPIMLHIFNGEYDRAFFNALAINHTKDAKIISPQREAERIQIFEAYACGGLSILNAELSNLDIDTEKQMVTFIAKSMHGKDLIDDITSLSGNL